MRYPFKHRGNKRITLAYLWIGVLSLGVVVPLLTFPGVFAFGIALISGFLAYQIARSLINHLKSYILTHDEGITLRFPDYTTERLAWDEITHAGIIQTPEQKTVRFIYAEPIDRLATIPEEYESLESLDEELKNRTPWYELTQKEGENIAKTILPLTSYADTTGPDAGNGSE